jgi:hypothetical protein
VFFPFQFLSATEINDLIRFRFESDKPGRKIEIRGILLINTVDIHIPYGDRNFGKICSKYGFLTELTCETRFEIRQSKFDKLYPDEYNLQVMKVFFSKLSNPIKKVKSLTNQVVW